ncbi:MAG TPA: type I-U CRISPR-associated helicase/endonuclease Cas3 [Stellaceae bacterium]
MTATVDAFDAQFAALTDHPPFCWQQRLFKCLMAGEQPTALDLPTGLGKTSVMAVWLIARAHHADLPRRLVYVVDRRAVVDQATTEAEKFRAALDRPEQAELKAALRLGERSLPISTLRGAFMDNREWLADPSLPAIVVGTVDMIGSRLLFSGYGVSRKMRPYHAGLLGADTLVVLDEAHLVPPFEKLLEAIEGGAKTFGPAAEGDCGIVPAFRLLSLSATGRDRPGEVFSLDEADFKDLIVAQRLDSPKRLQLEAPVPTSTLAEKMADRACERGADGHRVIIFCNSRKTAQAVADRLKKRDDAIELIVGGRRLREREVLSKSAVFKRFVPKTSTEKPPNPPIGPAFLVCTSAGEVGVDIDADHMVCDLVAWERMVQRLGRVNRLGGFTAGSLIDVFPALSEKDKEAEAAIDDERLRVWRAPFDSEHWPAGEDGRHDASPGMLRQLRADEAFMALTEAATTPAPLYPALSRPLVDAWSMTSLEKHTGRPEVAPWLRGWIEEDKQTSLLWRTHLPVRTEGGKASVQEVDDFFDAAPPHVSEILAAETWQVVDWLMARAKAPRPKKEPTNGIDAAEPSYEPLKPNDIAAFALTTAGDIKKSAYDGKPLVYTLANLMGGDTAAATLKNRLNRDLAGATLVLDARFAGLSSQGLLDERTTKPPNTADDDSDWLPPPLPDKRPAVRFRISRLPKGAKAAHPIKASDTYVFALTSSVDDENPERIEIDTWTTQNSRSLSSNLQLLADHQSCAGEKADKLATALSVPKTFADALIIAARLHDEGKRAENWQLAFSAPRKRNQHGEWEIFAKTEGPFRRKFLHRYRHEFGSLPLAEENEAFKALPCEMQELVLHLVAAHHGFARPVISTQGCEDASPSALEDRAREVALRFARLQKRWGPWGLAWWEALLRAADQQASRDNDQPSENGGTT